MPSIYVLAISLMFTANAGAPPLGVFDRQSQRFLSNQGWGGEVVAGRESMQRPLSVAWPFGPSTVEECILAGMKGVTSDLAARAIAQACHVKFPRSGDTACVPRALSGAELAKLRGSATQTFDIEIALHNGNENTTITGLSVVIVKSDGTELRFDRPAEWSIEPFSQGFVKLHAYALVPEKAKWNWRLIGGLGCSKK